MLLKKYKISVKFRIRFTRILFPDDDNLCGRCEEFQNNSVCNYKLCEQVNFNYDNKYKHAYLPERKR